ncbi:hypothetical protein ACIOMM_03145 [Streptomyces sp. NPDC087908]|uniref:hypothetical protein n=1 Tax=unclassified Streptomyces TaxID=2593676 RepID=UPI0011CE3EA3|nr:hypothetical protein [Streptomyces sp. adm13(2018)]TXS19241.1 hypothetical protein EAO70_10470 [Streptomyces sp. adm13(2018)]
MTNEHVLAVCRSNGEYRGLDDAAVCEVPAALRAHLEDAEAAGRTPHRGTLTRRRAHPHGPAGMPDGPPA